MAFWEIALHFLALDVPWIVDFLASNIFFIFMLFAAIYIVQDGKKVIPSFLTFAVIILLTKDLAPYFNLAIYTAVGLFIIYIFRLSVLSFLVHSGRSHFIKLAWFMTFWITLYVYNAFIV